MITFIALTTAHRALQEGIIGYQSEIREAYENLCAYLQDKFPAIDLAAVFAQPDNPAIKENIELFWIKELYDNSHPSLSIPIHLRPLWRTQPHHHWPDHQTRCCATLPFFLAEDRANHADCASLPNLSGLLE